MLLPKRVKFRKLQKGRRSGIAVKGSTINFGDSAIQVLENGWISNRQIEAARVAMQRHIKSGRVFIRIFPDKPITKKPAETRMGRGKGNPEFWVAVVKRGRILFEIQGVPSALAREAFRLAAYRLPLRTRFVARQGANA
jgi:large subunit ribosomal protein L16